MRKLMQRAALTALSLVPTVALSQQFTYTSGEVWGVTQYLPEGSLEEGDTRPACTLGTRVWEANGLDFRYELTSRDYIEPRLLLHSDGWQLPLGRSTKVTLVTIAGPMKFDLQATQPNALEGSLDPKVIGQENSMTMELLINGMLNTRGRGTGLVVRFAGSEPQWVIPGTEPREAYLTSKALNQCIADLRRKASTFYLPGGGAASGKPTSPFAEETENQQQSDAAEAESKPQPQPGASAATGGVWRFSEDEDEGATACFAAIEQDGKKVGFMGSPTEDLVGFVQGVFDKDTRVTWTIDGRAPRSSKGELDDYSDWYLFDELPASILDDVAEGKELRIAEFGGKGITVGLQGAREAIPPFKQCLAKQPTMTFDKYPQ